MMMIREVLDQLQGASALPGSAGEPITLTVRRLNWQLLARSLRLKPWYTIWMESLSPEFESPGLKNGRMLRGSMLISSLVKISGVSRFLGALPPQPVRKFWGRTHTWTGWSNLESRGFWVGSGGSWIISKATRKCPWMAGEPITLTVRRLNWQLRARSRRCEPWYAIYMESLSPEFESTSLKNGRMLHGSMLIHSLGKISRESRFWVFQPFQSHFEQSNWA